MEDKILIQICNVLSYNKADQICYLETKNINPLVQYYVICSANSSIHANALSNYVEDVLEKNNVPIIHKEGNEKSNWILIDSKDYVVHIFTEEEREKYSLEKLWSSEKIYMVK